MTERCSASLRRPTMECLSKNSAIIRKMCFKLVHAGFVAMPTVIPRCIAPGQKHTSVSCQFNCCRGLTVQEDDKRQTAASESGSTSSSETSLQFFISALLRVVHVNEIESKGCGFVSRQRVEQKLKLSTH